MLESIYPSRYLKLPTHFYSKVAPQAIKQAYWIHQNKTLGQSLGISEHDFQQSSSLAMLSGHQIPAHQSTLAMVYAGHQFGVWAGQLGDGRAITLGDLLHQQENQAYEIQLKGSGLTPYSRMGDGRAVLRSSVREYLCSEAMHGLGIPTTRALAIVGSPQITYREEPEKTAIVTRVAPSFIRFGSFEHWYYQRQFSQQKILADFVIAHHFAELHHSKTPYSDLLQIIINRTAQLFAQWQSVGFMHGVLNTDNMSILGLSLDYGPYGFMENYDPQHICNHSDTYGRYSYDNQAQIGLWNCHALAQTFVSLIEWEEKDYLDRIQTILDSYITTFDATMFDLWMQKLGFDTPKIPASEKANYEKLLADYLEILQLQEVDFTLAFRLLNQVYRDASLIPHHLLALFQDKQALTPWLQAYRQQLNNMAQTDSERHANMNTINPKYILRNYLAQQAIDKANQHDFSEIDKLMKILASPYDEQTPYEAYAQASPTWAKKICVSCSS